METKGQKIWKKRLETKFRHKKLVCKVYELKVVSSKLNSHQRHTFEMFFIEANWIYNYVLDLQKQGVDIFKISYKDYPMIKHLDKNGLEVGEELKFLSSQMKQCLFLTPKENICKLSAMKKAGIKVGRLNYKEEVNRIPLSQLGNTHKLFPEFNKVKLIGIKKAISVRGLHQIPEDSEIANAVLIKKASGFYIKVTTFQKPEEKIKTGKITGLDFGIKTGIVTTEDEKFNWNFQESKKLKRLQKRKNFKISGSKNHQKTIKKINFEYETISNKKTDAINKFVHKLITKNDYICIQDESIAEWKSSKKLGWATRIQHSILGGIIAKLKQNSATLKVNKWIKTTKECLNCGNEKEMTLDERIYECPKCGFKMERDLHSAFRVKQEGLKMLEVPMDCREFTLVEQINRSALKQENAIF